MQLKEAKEAFYEATGTLSDNTRNLLFAGIAIIWIFRTGDKNAGGIGFSESLLLPLGAFVIGLLLDILQYLYKSTVWWLCYKYYHGKRVPDDAEVAAPRFINVPTFLLFYFKIAACGWGFYCLLRYIVNALH